MTKLIFETQVVSVPWNLEGKRFDAAALTLAGAWFTPSLPRSLVQQAIQKNLILLQGAEASPSARVSRGDHITFTENFFKSIPQKKERLSPHQDLPLVIEENELFIVLYKPSFWLTHEVSDYQQEASLEDWLLQNELLPAGVPDNGRVHRLDRNTSGILLYGKTPEVQEELKTLFQRRKVKKTYIALVEGHLGEREGEVWAPIIRKKGSFKRMIAKNPDAEGVKQAQTSYRVMSRYPEHDLVLLTPKTGRTHQIRVHMASLGHPLAGDPLYGGKKELINRQFLHAWKLEFQLFGQKYAFVAPLASDLQKALSNLDETTLTRYDNEALQSIGLKPKKRHFRSFFSAKG